MKKKFIQMINRFTNNSAQALIMTYLVIIILLGIGVVLTLEVIQGRNITERQRLETVAFNIAEAGIEKALYYLKTDFEASGTTGCWSDGDINGLSVGPNTSAFYTLFGSTAFGDGTYAVHIKNDGTEGIWVQSVGTVNNVSRSIEVYEYLANVSIWNNAIFAGTGSSGALINGNVDVAGSVHILGQGLTSADYAVDVSGAAQLIGNNYSPMSAALKAKLPALPQVNFNGEMVDSLGAELRVKHGKVGLSGSADVGHPDVTGNTVKETLDGVFVTDGYGGSNGSSAVHSDNGSANPYDLGNSVSFPSLSDPHPSDPSKTFQAYYKTQALVLTNELSNIQPTSTFTYTDGTNTISMSGGNITIAGQVYISGGNNLGFYKQGGNKSITYSGKGTILVEGDVEITTDLMTTGAVSYPNNIIGIMSANNLTIGTNSQRDVMGLFYAENQITIDKQSEVAGGIVSNFFDMGSQVPNIFHVPSVAGNMPPGLIGTDPIYAIRGLGWREY